MTRAAITRLQRNANGYVLLVEGGRIDHAHHFGNAYRALTDTIALSEAVQAASELTSADDTLILVTADHAHTLSFVGYPVRGNPILGKVRGSSGEGGDAGQYALDALGLPYTTLSYSNGPGYVGASAQQPEGTKRYPHELSGAQACDARPPRPDRGRHRAPGLPAGSDRAGRQRIARRRRRRHLGARPGQRRGARQRRAERDLPLHAAGDAGAAREAVRDGRLRRQRRAGGVAEAGGFHSSAVALRRPRAVQAMCGAGQRLRVANAGAARGHQNGLASTR